MNFGNTFDAEGDQVDFSIDLGDAQSFADFDIYTHDLTIEQGKTTNSTAGRYPVQIILRDDAPDSRGGSMQTVYSFDLLVRFRPFGLELGEGSLDVTSVVRADEIYTILPEPETQGDGNSGDETEVNVQDAFELPIAAILADDFDSNSNE